jgi:hypothetical protein
MIPKNRLADIRRFKGKCKLSADYSWDKGTEETNDALSLLYRMNYHANTQLYFIYGYIEEIIESINNVDAAIRKLPSQPVFRETKNTLKETAKKEYTPTQEDIKREKRAKDVYR